MEKTTKTRFSSSSSKPMWTKAKEKRAATRRHTTNFNLGHIEIDEYHLSRTGLRGRKRWFLWCGVIGLLVIATVNLMLNCWLIATLGLTPNGLQYMMFLPNQTVLFTQPVNLSQIRIREALSSYWNKSLYFETNGSISLHAGPLLSTETRTLNSSQILIDSSGVQFKPFESFGLYSTDDKPMFLLNESLAILYNVSTLNSLRTPRLFAPKIVSTGNLTVSGHQINVVSGGAIHVESKKQLNIESKENIRLTFKDPDNGHFIVKSANRFQIPNLPINTGNRDTVGFELCICGNGKVFRAPQGCAQASGEHLCTL